MPKHVKISPCISFQYFNNFEQYVSNPFNTWLRYHQIYMTIVVLIVYINRYCSEDMLDDMIFLQDDLW